MQNLIYIDTETTGLDPERHAIHHLAAVVVIDGVVVERFEARMRPWDGAEIDDGALAVSGVTREEIMAYPSYGDSIFSFAKFLIPFPKLRPVGYNIGFDVSFLPRHQFSHSTLDVLDLVRHLSHFGLIDVSDHKLSTVCEYFGIPLEAQNAMNDIEATMKLHQLIGKNLMILEEWK